MKHKASGMYSPPKAVPTHSMDTFPFVPLAVQPVCLTLGYARPQKRPWEGQDIALLVICYGGASLGL